jgi:uncharacterized membrane protein
MENILQLFPVCVVIAIALVVVCAELIKKLDKKDRLKGYRVYIPLGLSCGAAWLLRAGGFFEPPQVWFWWAVIFAFSVLFFEAILKRLKTVMGDG